MNLNPLTWFRRGDSASDRELRQTRAALRLASAKAQLAALRAYEAAEKTRNTADWPYSNYSANTAFESDYLTTLARSRDAARNHWAARSILDTRVRKIVGAGITVQSDAVHPDTGAPLEAFNETVDALWADWSTTPDQCDSEGVKTLLQMQRMVVRECDEAGQAIIMLGYRPHPDHVGLTVQLFEPEQLDYSLTKAPETGNRVINGVEIDAYGRAVAYWLYPGEHPLHTYYPADSVRVPASRILHYTQPDRPRQVCGMPILAPVLKDLYHTKMYEDYVMLRARFEACVGATIETEADLDESDLGGMLDEDGGVTDDTDDDGNAQYVFEPGMVWPLARGKKANFHNPTTPGNEHVPYLRERFLHIAAGAGIDRATMMRDFSEGNFSNQKQGIIEMWQQLEPEQQRLIHGFIRPVREAFINVAMMEGRVVVSNLDRPEWRRAYMRADYQPQPRGSIDPAKEAAADKLRIEQRLTARPLLHNRDGHNTRELYRMIRQSRRMAAEYGITLPEDAPDGPTASPREPRPQGATPEGRLTPGGNNDDA